MESTGKVSDVIPAPEASILAIADSECPGKEAKVGSENKARFHPSDEELLTYYLKRKVLGESVGENVIPEINIYKYEPWDLTAWTAVESRTSYFFCSAKWLSTLANRKTPGGDWKSFGLNHEIVESTGCHVGYKRMWHYWLGVPEKGTSIRRTDWAMYEYQLHESVLVDRKDVDPRSYVLYKIFKADVSAKKMDHTPQKSTAALSSALTEGTEGSYTLSGLSSEKGPDSDFSTGKGESYPFWNQQTNTLFGQNESRFEQSEMTGSSTVVNLDIDIGKNQVSDYQGPVHDQIMTSVLAGSDDDASSGPCTSSDDDIGKNLVSDYQGQAESSKGGGNLSQPKMYENDPIENTAVKILEALTIDECRRICLYGKRGSGKTTVLKALFDYPATKNMFEQVILVSVPRFSHEKKILDDIVHQLSLTLNAQHSNSDDERRHLICQAFMSRKLLLLLDDVHKVINLHEIGVPEPGPENNHCLVLGTSSPALCRGVKTVDMESMSSSDIWELLHRQVGDVIDSPQITPFALKFAHECRYSPLIISAVGSALAAQSTAEDWRVVAQIQGSPGTSNTDDSLNPHIKYCYDRLQANDVKRCFLYSALLLEHKEILLSVLAESLVNANLLRGRTMAASKRANDIVERLIQMSLLEVNSVTRMVKMHTIIRDSALAILLSTIEGCQMFSRPGLSWLGGDQSHIHSLNRYLIEVGSQLKKPPPLQEWDQATMIFLMDNQFSTLPEKPNCPTLVSLFLQRNPYLRVIPASFFDSMLTLTNLDLSETRIRSLPDSLFNLKSLQVLLLRHCEHLIMLPSAIRQLKSLLVLDLQGTELTYLPDEVGELSNLKSLKVSFYGSINHKECSDLPTKLVGDGIISSLRLLEDLGMFVFPGDQRWNDVVSQIIKEVACLMLCTISFHFSKLESLDYFLHESKSWKNEDVTEFNFIVGHDFKHTVSLSTGVVESMHSSSERCLRLVNGETIPHGVVEILKRATSLYLDHHLSVSYLTDFGFDNMDALRMCIISDCPKFVAISNLDFQRCEEAILPSLEYMSLNSLWNFKSVTLGRQVAEKGTFQMLRYLSICSCSKLSFVFTLSMGTNLVNLEELVIEDCKFLKYVFIQDDMTNGDGDIIDAPSDTNPQNDGAVVVLRSLQVATFRYLPNLLGIGRITYPNIQSATFYNCPKAH